MCCVPFCGFDFPTYFFRQQRRWELWPRAAGFWELRPGANVIMPNLSPQNVRGKYLLYDNKLHTGAEAAEALNELQREVASIGYRIVSARGDYTEEPWTQG